MKKVYLLLASSMLVTVLNAQIDKNYKRFRVDIGIGATIHGQNPELEGTTGFLFALEPKYVLTKNFSAGLRLEVCFNEEKSQGFSPAFKGSGSYLITGDYYLSEKYSFRPFVGAGTGLFKVYGDVLKVFQGTVFGGMIRSGFEIKHFRVGVEYNLLSQSYYTAKSNNYLGIKLCIVLGGGKK